MNVQVRDELPHLVFGITASMVIVLLMATGCSGVSVTSASLSKRTFLPTDTYAWLADHEVTSGDTTAGVPPETSLDRRVRRTLEDHIETLGWRKVLPERATWLVSYKTSTEIRTRENDPYYSMYTAQKLEQGSLTVTILGPQDLTPAWQGTATDDVRYVARAVGVFGKHWAPTGRHAEWPVEEMVESLLTQLPPEATP